MEHTSGDRGHAAVFAPEDPPAARHPEVHA